MAVSLRKPPVIASVMALCGIGVLCGLGSWQIERLGEKTRFLEQRALWQSEAPQALSFDDFTAENAYRPGTLEGRWLGEEWRLIPRSFDGLPGAHLYQALELAQGQVVIVNRGFIVPGHYDEAAPAGQARLTGEIQPFPTPNMFTPENAPDSADIYRISPKIVAGEEVAPLIFREVAGGRVVPNTAATEAKVNNNHAAYAAFWFWMAAILGAIFALRFMVTIKRGD